MLEDRIAKLSDVQKRCLRLAAEGRSSKEIAPMVGLTHQTVDQYLQRARMTLGAGNRREAAWILAEIESARPFKGFEFKSPDVASSSESAISEVPTEQQQRQPKLLSLPATGGPPNDLTTAQKLTAIGKIALFLVIIVLTMILFIKGAFIVLS